MSTVVAKDLYAFHHVGNLQLSPDKKKLAYVDIVAKEEENIYHATIQVMDLASKKSFPLTAQGKEGSYSWLDDSTIVFTGCRDEKVQEKRKNKENWTIFYKISIYGGEAMEWFRVPLNVGGYRFLENGKLVLQATINHNYPFYQMKNDEKKLQEYHDAMNQKKDYEVFTDAPFWANGASIIDQNRSMLFLYDLTDESLVEMTDKESNAYLADVQGNKVLYTKAPYTGIRKIENGLYEYESEEKELVAPKDNLVSYAGYLKDGIVMNISTFEEYGYHQHGDLCVMKDGAVVTRTKHDNSLGSYLGCDVLQQFSESVILEGNTMYFVEVLSDKSVISALSDGNISTKYLVDGEIDDLAVIDDTHMVIIQNDGEHTPEIWMVEEGQAHPLTHLNDEWLSSKKIGHVRRIAYVSDGIAMEGFVIEPADYDATKKYPAILDIHGGPKGTYGSAFMYGLQTYVSDGYFAMYANPRGSDGRGNKYADIRGRFGKEDYYDLMAFVDAVLKEYPAIDASRLGVTGSSYGGYMTNWIITQTDRFACAIAEASISNYVTKFLCTDIGFTYNISNQAATPWDNIDLVWEQSPLKYANQVTTPTMFVHSDQDYRCWIAEPVQMYTALKIHNVPCKFVLFHGEHHGLSLFGTPTHRMQRFDVMHTWFDEHLK